MPPRALLLPRTKVARPCRRVRFTDFDLRELQHTPQSRLVLEPIAKRASRVANAPLADAPHQSKQVKNRAGEVVSSVGRALRWVCSIDFDLPKDRPFRRDVCDARSRSSRAEFQVRRCSTRVGDCWGESRRRETCSRATVELALQKSKKRGRPPLRPPSVLKSHRSPFMPSEARDLRRPATSGESSPKLQAHPDLLPGTAWFAARLPP